MESQHHTTYDNLGHDDGGLDRPLHALVRRPDEILYKSGQMAQDSLGRGMDKGRKSQGCPSPAVVGTAHRVDLIAGKDRTGGPRQMGLGEQDRGDGISQRPEESGAKDKRRNQLGQRGVCRPVGTGRAKTIEEQSDAAAVMKRGKRVQQSPARHRLRSAPGFRPVPGLRPPGF